MRDALGTSPMLRSRRGCMYSRVGGSRFHAAMGEVVEMRARRSMVGCGIEVFGMGGERCCFVRGRTSEVEVRSSGRASERKDKEPEVSCRAGIGHWPLALSSVAPASCSFTAIHSLQYETTETTLK